MQTYHPSLTRSLIGVTEHFVYRGPLGFLNLPRDLFVLLSSSFRSRRFFLGSRLALSLWFGTQREFSYSSQSVSSEKITKARQEHAQEIYDLLAELGGAFIKVGQFIATREDLVPKEYVQKLSSFQDAAPMMSFVEIEKILTASYGAELSDRFASIDPEPLASASIAQVHRATTNTGQEVVIKVQRPGLRELFTLDLAMVRAYACFFEKYSSFGKHRYWPEITDEFGKVLYEEIDFEHEAISAERMHLNLLPEHASFLQIPKVLWDWVRPNVLVLEYMPGRKITDITQSRRLGISVAEIGDRLIKVFFDQFFTYGFFHADPHPGNVVLNDQGKIVFHDFGMTYQIDPHVRENFEDAVIALVSRDENAVVESMKKMDLLRPNADLKSLRNLIQKTTFKYYGGARLQDINFSEIKDDINAIFANAPLRMPPELAYLFRTIGILEGICRTLDPRFDFISALKPAAKKLLLKRPGGEMLQTLGVWQKALPPSLQKALGQLSSIPDRASRLFADIENGTLQIPVDFSSMENRMLRIEAITAGMGYMILGVLASSLYVAFKAIPGIPDLVLYAPVVFGSVSVLFGAKKTLFKG